MNRTDWYSCNDVERLVSFAFPAWTDWTSRYVCLICTQALINFLPEAEFTELTRLSRQYLDDRSVEPALSRALDAATNLLDQNVYVPTTHNYAGSALIDATSLHTMTLERLLNCLSCAAHAIASDTTQSTPDSSFDHAYSDAYNAVCRQQCETIRKAMPYPKTGNAG